MLSDMVIEATRLWLEKAVIGLNLCPFAKAVYVKNLVRMVVSSAPHLDGLLEDLDRELVYLAHADPTECETTLLIHPGLLADFNDFNDFMLLAEAAVAEHDLEGVIQVASFHPQFQFADTASTDISNYTNRAPYPTLHLLREASISKAVEAYPDTEAIYQRNMAVLQEMGITGWTELWESPT